MKRHLAIAVLIFGTLAQLAGGAAALERGVFGWSSAEVKGRRPLLVVWLREDDDVPQAELGKYRQYYEDVVFGRNGRAEDELGFEPSAVAYFREVSEDKFTFSRAGLTGPLSAPLKGRRADDVARLALAAAAQQGGFNFAPFDIDRDGRIAPEELAVLVIANPLPPGGRAIELSGGGGFALPGQGVAFAGRVALVGERDGFAVLNRALFRILAPGAVDLDGWPGKCFALNGGRSLMAAGNTQNPALTMHLDPWHKMLVGWIEPRVFALGKAYAAKLAAQHVLARAAGELKRPILLYDTRRGPAEFFLLEYRTRSALGFDQAPVNSGLVVWQAALDAANHPYGLPADRPNCKGETLTIPSLFVRGAPHWQLGGSTAYWGGDGPFSLHWIDGKDVGTRVSVERHEAVDWRIAIGWTSLSPPPR